MTEKTAPKVQATLSDALKEAQLKIPSLRATLVLDSNDEYDMSIVNDAAVWQQADLPVQDPYDINVRFEIATGDNPETYLTVAQASHDFSQQSTKTFAASDLTTAFDEDTDTASNLDEFLAGGNPKNPGPTVLSPAQVTVFEKSTEVLTVRAISPRADAMNYSILLNDNNLFNIDGVTGELRFKTPVAFDNSASPKNQYSITVQANDSLYNTEQVITVTVTDVFDLKVNMALKQLQFFWDAHPDASYYKILQSTDSGSTFPQLSGNIISLSYNRPLSVHRFDPINTRFKLQAYDASNNLVKTSDELMITADLNSAIGYVKSIQTAASDLFGQSVAISADGNTLAVGAPNENNRTGAIHVYRRASGVWLPQGVITALNGGAGDGFGHAMALSADGNTLAVGARYESSAATGASTVPVAPDDNSATDAGAVYLYDRVGNTEAFSLRAYVKAPNTGVGDQFGIAVALSANGTTLAVGAHREDSAAQGIGGDQQDDCTNADGSQQNCAAESGAVYLFKWEQGVGGVKDAGKFTAYLKAPNRLLWPGDGPQRRWHHPGRRRYI